MVTGRSAADQRVDPLNVTCSRFEVPFTRLEEAAANLQSRVMGNERRKKQTSFLSFLPDNESSNRKKARMNDLTDEKIKVNDVSTGFASETFMVVLSSRSKAATGIRADRKMLSLDMSCQVHLCKVS